MRKSKFSIASLIVTLVFIAVLAVVAFNVIVVVSNEAIAKNTVNELIAIPLPENTSLVGSKAITGKLVGDSDGMQYFGAILIKSDLSLKELTDYYMKFDGIDSPEQIREQKSNVIEVLEHGSHSFGTRSATLDNHYIVYKWGHTDSTILRNNDIRGR